MGIVSFIGLALIIIVLLSNYSRTRGFLGAKILHFLSLLFLLYNHFQVIPWLINSLSNRNLINRINEKVGIISEELNIIHSLFYIVFSIIIVCCSLGILIRNNRSRKILLWILPFIIPISTISFYIRFKNQNPLINDHVILIIGFLISSLIYLGLFFLYKSKLMVSFFNEKIMKKDK
jgi:hypothetical protein